jgi:hypothetical protein
VEPVLGNEGTGFFFNRHSQLINLRYSYELSRTDPWFFCEVIRHCNLNSEECISQYNVWRENRGNTVDVQSTTISQSSHGEGAFPQMKYVLLVRYDELPLTEEEVHGDFDTRKL